jgi:hypothetical protein
MRRALLSTAGRWVVQSALVLGLAGIVMLTPGLGYGWGVISLNLNTILLPLLGAMVLIAEITAVFTNRVSFLGLVRRHQYNPTAFVGSWRSVSFMIGQYVLFMMLSVWLSTYVASFFEGHLVAAWGPLEMLQPGFSWEYHLAGIGVVSLTLSLFIMEAAHLAPGRGHESIDKKMDGAERSPEEKPAARKSLNAFKFKVFIGALGATLLLSTGLDLYRPIGGMLNGGFGLLCALYLAHYAIFNFVVGMTSVSKQIDTIQNLEDLAFGVVVFAGMWGAVCAS